MRRHGCIEGGREMGGLNRRKGRQAEGRGPRGEQRVFVHGPSLRRRGGAVEAFWLFSQTGASVRRRG